MTTRKILILLIALAGLCLWNSCSEDQNPMISKAHPEDWNKPASENFHGAKVLASGNETCTSCHGEDYMGGESQVSCYQCHSSYPHNQAFIANENSPAFHGLFLKEKDWDLSSCQECHGADYTGGESNASCFQCHASYPHQSGWLQQGNDQFHGQYLKAKDYALQGCQTCHGEDFMGEDTEISCYTCHSNYPHANGWLVPSDDQFHGEYIQNANWSLDNCQSCHGEDYKGGSSGASCTTCHTEPNGPEACNVCHGSAANAAPPQDLNDNTSTTAIGVGAHQLHYVLFDGGCNVCHTVPEQLNSQGHIDETPHAEVHSYWFWDREQETCTTICHKDTTKTYRWTGN